MAPFDPHQSIGFQCSLTFRLFTATLDERLRGSGVSRSQFLALVHLVSLGPLSQTALAGHLGVTPASAVRLVDRMERDGWVVRQPDPDDRRINRVAATAKAEEVWDELSGHAHAVLEKAYQGIDPTEIQTALAVLARVRENLAG